MSDPIIDAFLPNLRDAIASQIADAAAAIDTRIVAPQGQILPTYYLNDLTDQVQVDVLISSTRGTGQGREGIARTAPVDIVVQRKIADDAEIDPLIAVTEQIIRLFMMQEIQFGRYYAACLDYDHAVAYDRDELRKNRVFASYITLEFTVQEDPE